MSDTPTPTGRAPRPTGRNQGDPKGGLASATVSADLQPREGEETIADADALKILETRFSTTIPDNSAGGYWRGSQSVDPRNWGGSSKQGISEARRDLLARIVRMIPIEQRTTSVFQFVDIRPILSELMLTEQQANVSRKSKIVNDVPVGPDARVEAGMLLVEQNQIIHDQAFALAATQDFGTDAERESFINEFTYSYRDKGTGLTATPELALQSMTPEGTLTTPDQSMSAQQIAELPLYERFLTETGRIDGATTPYQFMDDSHIQWMFRMGMVDWNKLVESEAAKAEARRRGDTAPADFMVETGGIGGMSGSPDLDRNLAANGGQPYMRPGAPKPTSKVRLLDVFNSLYSTQWSTQEITNLQDKLTAAGYITDDPDSDKDGVRWTGRATDPVTQDAWRQLVVDSVNSGISMDQLLKDATVAKRLADDAATKASARDIVLTSAIGIRQTANALGQQTIGRELSQEQQAQVVEYIHNMERGQQTTMNQEGSQTVEDVDVEAAVKDFIERENGTEAGAMDLLNQFNTFQTVARRRG